MLLVMRRKGESICVGDDLEITIIKLNYGRVHIAIKSKKELGIKTDGKLIVIVKVDQTIMIGEIEILVTKLQGYQVHLGFKAPQAIRIMRKELLDP